MDNFEDQVFNQINYTEAGFPKGEYVQCTFKFCQFTGMDLSACLFENCEFDQCEISNVNLHKTLIQRCTFRQSRMMGLRFEDCNNILLSFDFYECNLELSTFLGIKGKGTNFKDCNLQSVDFTDARMSETDFAGSNLEDATFENTILRNADLSYASNFRIDPIKNSIAGAVFSRYRIEGLLNRFEIHIRD